MVGIRDICSPGLVLAMDFHRDIGGPEGDSEAAHGGNSRIEGVEGWEEAVLNVLEANDFDAIPLVTETNGRPSRIARRRYHDGDQSDLFVLDIEEVEVFGPRSSVIAVVFSVLSNEHHIALVGSEDSIDSIVTLDTLASPGSETPYLRRYLDQKVADVASSTGEELSADLGRRAFDGIRALADLVDSDRTGVSDRDFTKMAIDVLVQLQPLKDHPRTEVDLEPPPHWKPVRMPSEQVTAADFMRPFMVGVREELESSVTEDARDILSSANDFSNILLLSSEGEPKGLFRKSGGSWFVDEVGLNDPGQSAELVLQQLSNMDRRGDYPLVVLRMKEGGFGIISQEEASGDVPVFWLLKTLAVLERRCREWLVSKGVDEVRRYWNTKDTVPIEKASFGQILHHGSWFSEALSGGRINYLVHFRNDIVHSVVAERDPLDLGDISLALRSIKVLEKLIST